VKFTQALGLDGMALQQPAAFQMSVPQRPQFENVPTEPVVLKQGQTFELTSNVPLSDVDLQTSGGLQTKSMLDGQRVQFAMTKFRQGDETTVTVTAATSNQGAPLESPVSFVLKTPPPMPLPKFVPENRAQAVRLSARPYFEFESPPANPDSLIRSISMRPAIKGEWNWLDDVTLVFTPAERLPAQTTVNVTLKSGPDGPRTADGGYLDKDVTTSFFTGANRRIEVSIGKQQLFMFENERLIRTITVGTGVKGAETPPGQYEVLYKLPKTRMQGVNPSGVRYDLPDVPWVLPFMGDYAIHGVYWRNNFGTTASNGCVGMTVEEAKILYDWADVGTPIRIY
jgi:lipoprotein-anchoring transpeptidase ErfK/SrfK